MSLYKITFRLSHPRIEVELVSKFMGVEPNVSYSYGEEKKTPRGNLLGGRREYTYWCWRLPDDDSIEIALQKLYDHLAVRVEFLKEILSSGGELSLYISLYSNDGVGVSINKNLLRGLAEMDIGLMFEFLPMDLEKFRSDSESLSPP